MPCDLRSSKNLSGKTASNSISEYELLQRHTHFYLVEGMLLPLEEGALSQINLFHSPTAINWPLAESSALRGWETGQVSFNRESWKNFTSVYKGHHSSWWATVWHEGLRPPGCGLFWLSYTTGLYGHWELMETLTKVWAPSPMMYSSRLFLCIGHF